MTKTFFVACGFEINGSTIKFGAPSVAHKGLETRMLSGDGAPTVTALEGTGHATDSQGFDVYLSPNRREIDWCMRGDGWAQHVIVQEPLTTALLAELRLL